MSKFIDWLAGLGSHRREPDDTDRVAERLYQQLTSTSQSNEAQLLADTLIRRAIAEQSLPPQAQIERLRKRIAQLPPRQKKVLKLSAIDGLTYKEIAERVGVTHDVALRELSAAYHALSFEPRHR